MYKDNLAVEQSTYLTKTVNVYIVYDLDAWPINASNNVKVENCLFAVTNILKSSDKEKHVNSGYGIRFDSAWSWGFDDDFVRKVIIFDTDNNSSHHSDSHKNNFSILLIYGTNGSFGSPKKKIFLRIRYYKCSVTMELV